MTDTEPPKTPLGTFKVRIADPIHEAVTEEVRAALWEIDDLDGTYDFMDADGKVVFSAARHAVIWVRRVEAVGEAVAEEVAKLAARGRLQMDRR